MRLGAHVSIAGGIEKAPERAKEIGAEVFQIFSRSPQGGYRPDWSPRQIKEFQKNCQKIGFKEYYIHTPYYINLASGKSRIFRASILAIQEDLALADEIGAKYVVTHLGSARDLGKDMALFQVIKGLYGILRQSFKAQLLLENSAGAGEIIGDQFWELGFILKKVKKPLGVCFDTAHAFASGYDLSSKKALERTLAKLEKGLGLQNIKLLHFNDSKADLGSHIDRHCHFFKLEDLAYASSHWHCPAVV